MKTLRINVPVNICVSVPAGELAGEGDLCAEAAELVQDRIENRMEDVLRSWFSLAEDVRLYAIPAEDVIDNDRASVEDRDADDVVEPEARVNVPANVCISMPIAEGEKDGDVISRAALRVHEGISGDVESALRDGFDSEHDVRIYAIDPKDAVLDSSVEDVEVGGDEIRVTDLHEAARTGRLAEVADRLNEQSIALQDEHGATVAHVAVLSGHFDKLPAALQTAATLNLTNSEGQTVLEEACRSGCDAQFPPSLLGQVSDRPMTHAEIVQYAMARGVQGARLERVDSKLLLAGNGLGWHLVGTGWDGDGYSLVSDVCEELGMRFGEDGRARNLDRRQDGPQAEYWQQCSPQKSRLPGTRKDLRDYTPETLSLLDHLTKAGFELIEADNGEERHRITSPLMAAAVLTGADEPRLHVKAPDGRPLCVFLVYGNNPGELVALHGPLHGKYDVHPLLESTVNTFSNEWQGKEQPMTDRVTAEAFTRQHYPKAPAAPQAKRR